MATARTIDQIQSELSSTFDPQIGSIRQRADLIPQQIAEEEKGLLARQEQAFGDILGGARRRGLGFSGIPLSEQARYTSTEFLPAMARLRQSGREQALSLEDAILGINERRNTLAQSIFQQESDRAFQAAEAEKQRQFQAQQAALERARSGGGGFSPTLGGVGLPTSGGGQAPRGVAPELQQLFNQVFIKPNGQAWDDGALKSDYARTAVSAGYGNARDKQKLQLYHSVRPDLFGSSPNINAFGNGGQVRF